MCERVEGTAGAVETPIGYLPGRERPRPGRAGHRAGGHLRELLRVDADAWRAELPDIEKHFAQFGDRLPARLREQVGALRERLG